MTLPETRKVHIGIDLGTTNTCVSKYTVLANGKVTHDIVTNNLGDNTTPSIVCFTDEILIGSAARANQGRFPEQTIYGSKRLLGQRYSQRLLDQKIFQHMPFKILKDNKMKPYYQVQYNGASINKYPEEISALILSEIKQRVKAMTNYTELSVVISVPAYFSNEQKNATLDAARIAGFDEVKLIPEPTAAAIAYQIRSGLKEGRVMVFDFGGGTLDVSIIDVSDNKFTVLAVSGDCELGGEDIDALILEDMLERFKEKNGIEETISDPRAISILRQECERAKRQVAATNIRGVPIIIAPFFNGKDFQESLTRAQFNDIMELNIEPRLGQPITDALQSAKLIKEDITHIIMVGGSSRIQRVIDYVKSYFDDRIEPFHGVNPDEAVAVGASYVAQLNIEDHNRVIPHPIDIIPHSIGIREGFDNFLIYIPKNSEYPTSKKFHFMNQTPDATFVEIAVATGEHPSFRNNRIIGIYRLEPLLKQKYTTLEITIVVDDSGIMSIKAFALDDPSLAVHAKLESSSRLTDDALIRAQDFNTNIAAIHELKAECDGKSNKLSENITKINRKIPKSSRTPELINLVNETNRIIDDYNNPHAIDITFYNEYISTFDRLLDIFAKPPYNI